MTEPPAPIERTADGDFRVHLGPEERDLLRRLTTELEELLAAEPEDPSLRRLRPRAYDDEQVEREYRSLMGSELESLRLENLRALEETAGRDRLDAGELDRWLAALNDLRLVLGTRLDVTRGRVRGRVRPERAARLRARRLRLPHVATRSGRPGAPRASSGSGKRCGRG